MNEPGANGGGPGAEGPRNTNTGDLWEAIQSLAGRLGEVLTGPEAQQVKSELEARVQEIGHEIDGALEGPQAQALKERVAELLRTIQQQLKR